MASTTLLKDGNGLSTVVGTPVNITTTTTTLVKTGAGFLYTITFNKPVATGTVEIDDAVTNTNSKGIVTTPANPQPVTLTYNMEFLTGLSITTATAAQDITVVYR